MAVNKAGQNEFSGCFDFLSLLRDFYLSGRTDRFDFAVFDQNDGVGERLFPRAINECPANYGYESRLSKK
ncbi:MAG: hypothetical protein PHU81_08000 [Acidobacteriota bacterium]|nr:hypothetical protein [Acidobacteriota bacterium]